LDTKDIINALHYKKIEDKGIYIHNEIFEYLLIHKDDFNSPSHMSFTYSCYQLITYLYRYAKYGDDSYPTKRLKEILGYSSINKQLDYITKDGGLLEELQLVEKTDNYPINFKQIGNDPVEFHTYNDYIEDSPVDYPQMSIFKPIPAFYRNPDDDYYSGTYYDVAYTHNIGMTRFIQIMSDKKLGTTGHMIFGYLKFKTDTCGGKYSASIEQLKRETGISERTLIRRLKRLEDMNYIHVTRSPINKENPNDREPNVYRIVELEEED
jgi:hypothetical protein